MPRTRDADRRESWVENYLREQVELYGGLCIKTAKRRGWPDREVFWYFGVYDLIETKRPSGGTFEPLQLRTHAKLRQRGFNVLVINTREQVDEYIRSRQHAFRSSKRSL